jgi:putative ABC transport system ATP-binding protein
MSITAEGICKSYQTNAGEFCALKHTNLTFSAGEFVSLTGVSGSGKSTLLNLLSGIDNPTSGAVKLDGQDYSSLNESALAKFRGQQIGIVFQFFQLLPTLTAIENILLAMELSKKLPSQQWRSKAHQIMHKLDIVKLADKMPTQLSGGEQQRVAICRALANEPTILIADEPTGNLDSHNSQMILALFKALAREGRCVIIATHNTASLNEFDRIIRLEDGEIVSDDVNHNPLLDLKVLVS